jgi:hypothetical protein
MRVAAAFRTLRPRLTVTGQLEVAPSDFDQYCINCADRQPAAHTAASSLCGLFDVRPSLFGQTDNVIKSAEDSAAARPASSTAST